MVDKMPKQEPVRVEHKESKPEPKEPAEKKEPSPDELKKIFDAK
jgi:hypothetical protein